MTARAVVLGVGNRFRHDDGFGPLLLETIKPQLPVDVVAGESDGEPSRLLDAWSGAGIAVVIETVIRGDAPGSVVQFEVTDGVDRIPPPVREGGTHSLGLADAIALGRALGRMPGRLVVIGVEPANLGYGEGLSEPVTRSMATVTRLVLEHAGSEG